MKTRNKLLGTLLGLGFFFTHHAPVHASSGSADHVEQSSVLQIPVIFKEDLSHSGLSLQEGPVEKYSEGTVVGYDLNGELKVAVEGQTVSVSPKTVAISEEEKEKLREDQQKEADKLEKREKALARIRAEKTPGSSEEAVDIDTIGDEDLEVALGSSYEWSGSVLSRSAGVNQGPSGRETYYNLPMQGVVAIMRSIGNTDEYWVREDGVKMLGDYVMVAAHLPTRPRGSLIPTSLGMGIVCDTGTFALSDHTQLDIAVNW